jgi:hypothetical protein
MGTRAGPCRSGALGGRTSRPPSGPALAVPHAGHHAIPGLPPAQLPWRVHPEGWAQGAVARRPLPRRGPGGMGRSGQLRAAVAEAGQRRKPPGRAEQSVGAARGGHRRRRVLERAGVPVHRRRRGGGVPGGPRRGRAARPGERQGPRDRAQHPGRIHPCHPPRPASSTWRTSTSWGAPTRGGRTTA